MDESIVKAVQRYGVDAAKEALPKLEEVMQNMAEEANAVYIQAANQAAIRAKSVGREQALREAVAGMAKKGISSYSYTRADKSGNVSRVHVSADVGVRRIINDAMRKRQISQTVDIARKTGCNLVEVSSTSNARPSHQAWQGKVYSLDGETEEYPNFEKSCHVGDPVNGIGGYNCGHTVTLYHEGHKRIYEDPLKGTGYTTEEVRKLTDEQRRIEREIREQKRVREVLKASGFDTRSESAKIRLLEQELDRLISDNAKVLTPRKGYRDAIAPILRKREGATGVVKLYSKSEDEFKEKVISRAIKRATRAEKGVTDALSNAALRNATHMEGLDFRVKTIDSLRRKARTDFDDWIVENSRDYMVDYSKMVDDIHDTLRYTMIALPEEFGAAYAGVKKDLEASGYSFVRVKNSMTKTNGAYRGVNTWVRSPKGYTFELQFHTMESFNAKQKAHAYYEIERTAVEGSREQKAARRAQKEIFTSFETPRGAASIKEIGG